MQRPDDEIRARLREFTTEQLLWEISRRFEWWMLNALFEIEVLPNQNGTSLSEEKHPAPKA